LLLPDIFVKQFAILPGQNSTHPHFGLQNGADEVFNAPAALPPLKDVSG
jgi:hypothetical protein